MSFGSIHIGNRLYDYHMLIAPYLSDKRGFPLICIVNPFVGRRMTVKSL